MTVNIVNNYYKPGPGTPTDKKGYRIAGIGVRTKSYVNTYPAYAPALHLWGKYYVTGNYNSKYSTVNNDNWTYGIINQVDANGCDGTFTAKTKDTIKLESPMPFVVTTTHSAADAYDRVLAYAGASLSRDTFDELMVSDTRDGKATYTGFGLSKGFVNSQDDNKPAGAPADWSAWPTLVSTEAPVDKDGDGMPDAWETANGLNPNDASDGPLTAANGYTNLENYLNSLVADITAAQNAGGTIEGDIQYVEEVTDYEISPVTSADDNWNFANGFSITASGKGYSTGKGCGMQGIKYSRNFDYTVNIPEGIAITGGTFTGYCNGIGQTAYLAKFGGDTYGATDYTFDGNDAAEAKTQIVKLSQPATGSLLVRFGGDNQVVMNMTLSAGASSGIEEIYAPSALSGADTRVYTFDGRLVTGDVRSLSKGVYIINKKKVVIR